MEKNKMEVLAKDIYNWCVQKGLWGDNIIYFNGKAWSSSEEWNGIKGKEIAENLYEYKSKNPKDYFEYTNPDTLSMSFEGPLYMALNGYVGNWNKTEQKFAKLFEKYGLYYELGYAWSLSAYEI